MQLVVLFYWYPNTVSSTISYCMWWHTWLRKAKITCLLRVILNKRCLHLMDCIFCFAVLQQIGCLQAADASRAEGIIYGVRSCWTAWVTVNWWCESRLRFTPVDTQLTPSMKNRKIHIQKDLQQQIIRTDHHNLSAGKQVLKDETGRSDCKTLLHCNYQQIWNVL